MLTTTPSLAPAAVASLLPLVIETRLPVRGEITITRILGSHRREDVEPLASGPPDGSFGALLRACRHRTCLSQEQLAERAELSERTVRNLEAGRVRSPRNDTVRLLADALELTEPEREAWLAAARSANGRGTEPAIPGARGPAQLLPSDAPARPPLSARGLDIENDSRCRRSYTTEFMVRIVCELADQADTGRARPLSPGHPGCPLLVSIRLQDGGLAARDVVHRIAFDKLAPAG